MPKRTNLFDEDGGEELEIKVDDTYQKKYTEKKRREAIARLDSKKGGGKRIDGFHNEESDTDSEEEDEDAALLSRNIQKEFLTIVPLIKSKDPTIYDKEKKSFFSTPKFPTQEEGEEEKKKKEKYSLSDMIRDKAIEDVEKGEGRMEEHVDRYTYDEEQENLRKEFLTSFEAAMDGEDSKENFQMKKKTKQDQEKEEKAFQDWQKTIRTEKTLKKKADVLEDFWNITDDIDDDEKFLRDYILNERWKEVDSTTDYANEIDQEEEHEEKAEQFENTYNFRHEEGGTLEDVIGHSRNQPDSIRNDKSKRKSQRERKKERDREEKVKRQEELKRLKNFKKKEMEKKLMMAAEIAGLDVLLESDQQNKKKKKSKKEKGEEEENFELPELLKDIDLDSDFDPDKFDEQMGKIFSDTYYDGEDESFAPDEYDDEDEDDRDDGDAEGEEGVDKKDEEIYVQDQKKVVSEKKIKELAKEKLRGEFDQMDFEDLVGGDLPTRFKYTEVPKKGYGYTNEDLLEIPEEVLNQRVSLKLMAPYMDKEYRPPSRNKKAEKKSIWESNERKQRGEGRKKRKRRKGAGEKGWDAVLEEVLEKNKVEPVVDEGAEKEEKKKDREEKKNKEQEKEERRASRKRKREEEKEEEEREQAGQKKKRRRTRKRKNKEEK